MRNNEVYGDMTAWIAAHAGDNEGDLMRLKRNLRLAREEELTARQRELLRGSAAVPVSATCAAGKLRRTLAAARHQVQRTC